MFFAINPLHAKPEPSAEKMKHEKVQIQDSKKQNSKKNAEAEKLKKMASRGKMLYLNHCHACHESNVHIRAHRKVKKKSDIGYWVKRWSKYLKLNWKESDRLQVIEHLNKTYYKF